MMGMTTLLTLYTSFASLSTVTPPISYTTRLDVWMVTCIVFVFLTMAEFTLVIILKYYLFNHIPTFCFERLLRKPPEQNNSETEKETVNFIEEFMLQNVERASIESSSELLEETNRKQHVSLTERKRKLSERRKSFNLSRECEDRNNSCKKNVKTESVHHDYDQYLLDEKQRISQYIINIIEKNSVFVFLMAFLTFNVVYWRDISLITSDINRIFENNNFIIS